jgi:hypothetical protein
MRAMRKGVAALLVGAGFVACADKAPDAGNTTPVVVPSVTPPAPGSGAAMMTFEGHYDAKTKELSIAYRVPSTAVGTQAVLPYGTGVDQVYFHTVSVLWQGACGTNNLCAPVTARNGYSGIVTNLSAVFNAFAPADVTAVGAPYVYGSVPARSGATDGESSTKTWTFNDPTGANFQFVGYADGTPPAATGGATLAASPSPLVLPTIVVGTSQTNPSYVTVTETSGTSATGTLTVVRTTTGDAAIVAGTAGCSGTTLAASGTCQNAYTLNCVGATSGAKSAGFTVTDPASGNTAVYTVSGQCDPTPPGAAFLTVTPTSYNFGAVFLGDQATPTPDFTIKNTGTGITGTLSSPTLTSKVGNALFRFTGDCGTSTTVLAPGAKCSVGHNLDCRSPATAGTQSVNVTETDPSSGSSATIALTGSCACRPNAPSTPTTASDCGSNSECCSNNCSAFTCMP